MLNEMAPVDGERRDSGPRSGGARPPTRSEARKEPFPSKPWHCACLVLLLAGPPTFLLVQNAREVVSLRWTLGLSSVLVLLGFMSCAHSMSQLDEEELMDVGGDMVGFSTAIPLLLAFALWTLECVIILVCRAILGQPLFTDALVRHLLTLGGVVLLGLAIDYTRNHWSKLLPDRLRADYDPSPRRTPWGTGGFA